MICSTLEEDVVAPAPSAMPTAVPRHESMRLLPDDLLLGSVRSSVVSNASAVADLKQHHSVFVSASATQSLSQSQSQSASSPSTRPRSAPTGRSSNPSTSSSSTHARSRRARFENKIRLLAQYMRTLSMGRAPRQRTPPGTVVAGHTQSQSQRGPVPQMVKRRSQVSLSQHSLLQSASDVLDPNKSGHSLLNGADPNRVGSTTLTRGSSSQTQASLSWDEIIAGAIFVEENEVMPASPRSRKRGRPCSEVFEDSELRHLCKTCGVPDENMDQVVHMIFTQFGTCQLDLTVFHELVGCNSVVVIGMLVFSCIDCGQELLDLHSLPAFLHHIQSRYDPENPFHNACHAADVLHSFFMMLWSSQLGARVAISNQIGALFGAVMHDIEHIGLTNDFLLKTNHALAVQYPTRAPMEEMHADVAMDLLTDAKFNVLAKFSNEQLEQVVTVVRESIQSTALCYQKDLLRDVAAVPADEWVGEILPLRLQTLALRCAMHVSDISQTMKPFSIHNKWVSRLNEELFLQGDLDAKLQLAVCPDAYFRDKWTQDSFLTSQIWFLQNMALPAAQCFNSIPFLHVPVLEENLQANVAQWQAQRLAGTATTPISTP